MEIPGSDLVITSVMAAARHAVGSAFAVANAAEDTVVSAVEAGVEVADVAYDKASAVVFREAIEALDRAEAAFKAVANVVPPVA